MPTSSGTRSSSTRARTKSIGRGSRGEAHFDPLEPVLDRDASASADDAELSRTRWLCPTGQGKAGGVVAGQPGNQTLAVDVIGKE